MVKKAYEHKKAVLDFEKLVEFESDSITLDVPSHSIKDWTITPKFPPVVRFVCATDLVDLLSCSGIYM